MIKNLIQFAKPYRCLFIAESLWKLYYYLKLGEPKLFLIYTQVWTLFYYVICSFSSKGKNNFTETNEKSEDFCFINQYKNIKLYEITMFYLLFCQSQNIHILTFPYSKQTLHFNNKHLQFQQHHNISNKYIQITKLFKITLLFNQKLTFSQFCSFFHFLNISFFLLMSNNFQNYWNFIPPYQFYDHLLLIFPDPQSSPNLNGCF